MHKSGVPHPAVTKKSNYQTIGTR